MGRKPTSVPGVKYLFPSYYLRRPRRLGFLSLIFVVLFFFFMDRQNQARELETMASRIQQLEGERGSLMAELNFAKGDHAQAQGTEQAQQQQAATHETSNASAGSGSGDQAASQGVKADPLILGVGVGRGARKLLPKKEEGANAAAGGQALLTGGAGAQEGQGAAQKQGAGSSDGLSKEASEALRLAEERRESIRQGMQHAWEGYVKYAWGEDELEPLSKNGVSNFGGMGASIVDSLDTLFIMGLTDQFNKARDWVAKELHFDKDYTCSVFETTIRVLGGLLSAYDLSGDGIFLQKARDLADRLLPAWSTGTGIPWHYLNLQSGQGSSPGWAGGSTVLADAGTTQVEMIALTQRTNNSLYAAKSEGVIRAIDKVFPSDGLCPYYINPYSGQFTGGVISFGAMGDSFFEYLLKVWVQGGKTPVVKRYREMWEISMRGMMSDLVKHTNNGFTYVAEKHNGGIVAKMDHLLCFAPGMLALGAKDADEELAKEYMDLAKGLTKTCYEFYNSQPSKLSGENYHFNDHGLSVGQPYNIGRPETVEALFYMWRTTKDPIYREWGWNIWQAFQKHCRVDSGYTGLRDVSSDPPPKDNMMQSFFLAETMKYLYLLFSPDDVMPLDQWVFNTEAHPVKIIPRHQPF